MTHGKECFPKHYQSLRASEDGNSCFCGTLKKSNLRILQPPPLLQGRLLDRQTRETKSAVNECTGFEKGMTASQADRQVNNIHGT